MPHDARTHADGTVWVPVTAGIGGGEPGGEAVEITLGGEQFDVPMAVAAELARLRDAVRGAAVVVGEAMRLRDAGLDLVDKVRETLEQKGRLSTWQGSAWLAEAEGLLAQREMQRGRRTDGRG